MFGLTPERRARLRRPAWLGTLRRTTPLSDHWGRERGQPVDRHYIEAFIEAHRGDIRGDVLELLDSTYARRYGTHLSRVDVLDIDAANPRATVVADLTRADQMPIGAYDCFICTQTLQFVYDLQSAVALAHRALRPGGTLLVTVPAVSRISRRELETEHWRFTEASCRRLFGDVFGAANVTVEAHGNVLVAIAALTGLATEELRARELDFDDAFFPVVVCVRAVRA